MKSILHLFIFGCGYWATLLGSEEPFPELSEAKWLRGELVYSDPVNRRGTLRLHVDDYFHEQRLHHFAMFPDGVIYYHGAPAALRDIPIGTNLYGQFHLPVNPETSVVPIINKPKQGQPAETHAIRLEDGPSLALRSKTNWTVLQFKIDGKSGTITAKSPTDTKHAVTLSGEHTFTIDGSTRIWQGTQLLALKNLTNDHMIDMQVYLSLTWHPRYLYQKFHVADLWLDQAAMDAATERQRQIHLRYIKHRWLPARVIDVKYGEHGQGVVTVILHNGMDHSLYQDFKPGIAGQMAVAETTLRTYWQDHDGSEGTIISIKKETNPLKTRLSGITVQFETDLLQAGFRPGQTVKIRPASWPKIKPPIEERIQTYEDRWPNSERFK